MGRRKASLNKCGILLVEDEAIIALQTAKSLRDRAYSVVHASSGEAAVELIRSGAEDIDLVLMDINLGDGMDGTDSAREILKLRDIPIVFLSSHTEKELVEKTEEVGSYGYVVKNSGITILEASIKMAFRLFEAHGELAHSEDKFSKAFSLSPDAISITRLSDGVYIDINRGFTAIMGYTREEVLGRSSLPGDLGIWVHAEDREPMTRVLREHGEVSDLEAEFRRKDGTILAGLLSARIIEIDSEHCLLLILRDITDRKIAERNLASLNRIQAVVGKATQLILRESDWQKLLDGACRIAVEDGGIRMAWIGLSDEERALVRPIASAGAVDGYLDLIEISLSDRPSGRGPTGTAARTGSISVCADIERDPRIVWRDAALERGYRSMASIPLRMGGKVLGVFNFYSGELGFFGEKETSLLDQLALDLSFALDTRRTEELRAEAERKLRESDRLYRESFMQSSAVKLLIDPAGGAIIDANLAAAEFYGYPIAALKAMKVSDLNVSAPDIVSADIALARNRRKNRFFVRHRLASGEVRDIEVFSSPIELDGATLLHSIIFDITEQKKAEAGLAASEARFRTAFKDAPVGMALADPSSGTILDVNKAFCDMLERPSAELVALPYASFTCPEDLEASVEAVASCLSGARSSARLVKRYLNKDGRPVWADVSLSLMRGADGEPLVFIIHMLDIGERMQYEKKLEQLILQKETLMKELQHRVKNNLNVVSGLLSLESSKCRDELSRQAFSNVMSRVDSIAAIYDRLCHSEDQTSVDLALHVRDLAGSLFETYNLDPRRIELKVRAESVRLDTKRSLPFSLILNELVTNALKYAYPGEAKGEVRVELKSEGERLTLTVSDDGVGMPEEPGPGGSESTGMTLVRVLTEQLDGTLSVEGTKGTRVGVSFSL